MQDYSTCTVLVQMIDEWQSEQENRKLVGAVLVDFSF